MSKYLVLYKVDPAHVSGSVADMFANTPPEQLQAGMAMWMTWYGKAGPAIVDGGAPLDKSHTVDGAGATPFKTPVTGYTVLEAGSLEQALDLVKDHPHLFGPHASIEVLEAIPMPGM